MISHLSMIRLYLIISLLTSYALSRQIALDLDQDQSPHVCEESHTGSKAFDLLMTGTGMRDQFACEGPSCKPNHFHASHQNFLR